MPCPGDPGPRPTFIPVPKSARAVMRYSCFGQTVENVFHFSQTDDYAESDCAALAGAIVTAWGAEIKPLLSPDVTLEDVTVTAIHVASGPQSIAAAGIAGTAAEAGFDTIGNTIAIKFGTGNSGRSYRGRMYWPQLLASGVTNNELSLVAAGAYISALSDFFAAVNTAVGSDHVIVSYQNDCEWRDEGVSTFVTSYSVVDRHLDSQRRRLSGRGV